MPWQIYLSESRDISSEAVAYVVHGVLHFAKESLEKAEEHLLKGLELSELTNLYSWNFVARLHLGEIYFETRDFPKCKEHYEKGIRVLEHNRALPSWTNLQKVGLAKSKVMDKEQDVVLESLFAYL